MAKNTDTSYNVTGKKSATIFILFTVFKFYSNQVEISYLLFWVLSPPINIKTYTI